MRPILESQPLRGEEWVEPIPGLPHWAVKDGPVGAKNGSNRSRLRHRVSPTRQRGVEERPKCRAEQGRLSLRESPVRRTVSIRNALSPETILSRSERRLCSAPNRSGGRWRSGTAYRRSEIECHDLFFAPKGPAFTAQGGSPGLRPTKSSAPKGPACEPENAGTFGAKNGSTDPRASAPGCKSRPRWGEVKVAGIGIGRPIRRLQPTPSRTARGSRRGRRPSGGPRRRNRGR